MTPEGDLSVIRRAFAKMVVHAARCADPRLEAALAETRREHFLGPGPWSIVRVIDRAFEQQTPDADPLYLYQDAPVSLSTDRGLNNGVPSFVTMMIDLCRIGEGDRMVHVGTGPGYYTALASRLAGPGGHVLGLEIDSGLADRAISALRAYPNTTVACGDGFTYPLEPVDAILVNAGTPRFAATWLDALKPGGRLVVPLAAHHMVGANTMTRGIVFQLVRDADGFAAAARSGVMIYPCAGASAPEAETALVEALDRGDAAKVRRLRIDEDVSDARCWLRGQGWSLTYD